jgi:hypothetical protein
MSSAQGVFGATETPQLKFLSLRTENDPVIQVQVQSCTPILYRDSGTKPPFNQLLVDAQILEISDNRSARLLTS